MNVRGNMDELIAIMLEITEMAILRGNCVVKNF